jgi:hypothetical protein
MFVNHNAILSIMPLGVGSAFGAFGTKGGEPEFLNNLGCPNADWQSNFLISTRSEDGAEDNILVDAGAYLPLI